MSDEHGGQSAPSVPVREPLRERAGRALGAEGRYFPPSFVPVRGSGGGGEGRKKAAARARRFSRRVPPRFPGRAHLPARHPRRGRGQRGWLVPGAPGPRSGRRRRVSVGGLRGDSRVSRPAARLLRRRQPAPAAASPCSLLGPSRFRRDTVHTPPSVT